MREYSRRQVFIANLPYAVMVLAGAATIVSVCGTGGRSTAGAVAYLLYGIGGALWVMLFICPFCAYYGTRGCPCGYGVVSSRIAPRGDRVCFSEKFKRHIPVIVPLWFIPAVCGVLGLVRSPSPVSTILLIIFILDGFVVLPLVSRRHSCAECPQGSDCPWMGKKKGVVNRT